MFPDFVAYLGSLGFIDYVTPCTTELARGSKAKLKTKWDSHARPWCIDCRSEPKEAFQKNRID